MANQIGTFTFQQWIGTMPRPRRPILRLPAFSGVNNNVLIRGASRIDSATIRTANQLASMSLAQSLITSYLSSIGAVVTVVDQFGVVFTQCTILNADSVPSYILGGARLDTTWLIDVPL